MIHSTSPLFWSAYDALPPSIQRIADRNYEILKINPRHPSLHFKKINRFRSVRIGNHYRALGVKIEDSLLWFWIGSHAEYDKIIKT